jgi:hypothetical protein
MVFSIFWPYGPKMPIDTGVLAMPTKSFSISVIRPQDLLVLTFSFRDVNFTPPAGGQPGQVAGQAGALLIAHFQPQHIAEQAFFQVTDTPGDPGNEPTPPPGRIGAAAGRHQQLLGRKGTFAAVR